MMIETKHQADPNALDDADRQPCEVWTRVMGYHRPVASFNTGKKGEHYERRFFREEHAHLENSGNRRLGSSDDHARA